MVSSHKESLDALTFLVGERLVGSGENALFVILAICAICAIGKRIVSHFATDFVHFQDSLN